MVMATLYSTTLLLNRILCEFPPPSGDSVTTPELILREMKELAAPEDTDAGELERLEHEHDSLEQRAQAAEALHERGFE